MGVERCPNGHYYDNVQYASCPFCGVKLSVSAMEAMSNERTVAMNGLDGERTVAMMSDDDITIAGLDIDDSDVTVGFYTDKFGGEPTVGWLVCTKGPEKGRDYRLRPAKNFIGRAASMDISIFDDPAISRDEHLSIVYDPKGNSFIAVAGNGASAVNGVLLENTVSLNEGDRIEAGDTTLTFIPFCKGDRKWED